MLILMLMLMMMLMGRGPQNRIVRDCNATVVPLLPLLPQLIPLSTAVLSIARAGNDCW